MRRVLLAVSGTVAGLVMLLSFKSHTASTAAAGLSAGLPGTAPAGSGSSAAGSVTGAGRPASSSAAPGSGRSGSGSSGAGPGSGGSATTVLTGRAISTMYGPMQVQATLTGGKLTKVTVLQHTDLGAESEQIDATAIPELTRETLAAQSARIDGVSGASYTSSGYIQSLQSALDKARA